MTTDSPRNYRPSLSRETHDDLAALAQALGFYLNGTPSVTQLLEALGEVHSADPGGTHLALKVLLRENDLLPEGPPDAAESVAP